MSIKEKRKKGSVKHRFVYYMNTNMLAKPHFVIARGRFILGGGMNVSWDDDDDTEIHISLIKKWYILAAYNDCEYAKKSMQKLRDLEKWWLSNVEVRGKAVRPASEGAGKHIPLQDMCEECRFQDICTAPLEIGNFVTPEFLLFDVGQENHND